MNRPAKLSLSDATVSEVFAALRSAFFLSMVGIVIVGLFVLLGNGADRTGIDQLLRQIHGWGWVLLVAFLALAFPKPTSGALATLGKALVEFSEDLGNQSVRQRVLLFAFAVVLVAAFSLSVLLGAWISYFVIAFVSTLKGKLEQRKLHSDAEE